MLRIAGRTGSDELAVRRIVPADCDVPPAEAEAAFYAALEDTPMAA